MALNEQLKRWLPPLALALVFGGLTIVFVHRYLLQQRAEMRKELEKEVALRTQLQTVDVVVAARDLDEGTTLEASHISRVTIPEIAAQPYVARLPKDVLGFITRAPMAANEQILTNKLRRPDEVPVGSTLSSLTPKGKRAVTIVVDTISGVGGFVRPGDIIDILWTIKLPQPGQEEGQVVTLTLFQDVPILAVGRDLGQGKASASKPPAEEGAQYTVTLALTPQEIAFLLFAREQGRIQLALRPKAETGSQVSVVPANINTLMELQLKLKTPSQEDIAKPSEVEIYKGLDRDVVAVPGGNE